MFGKRKRTYPGISYDLETNVMLIKGQDDLDMFMKIYNLSSITKEW